LTTARSHALYRFYDAGGALLYVGITLDPGARWRAHRDDKPWWHQVATISLEVHPTRDAVLAAERAAIVAEKPQHNVVHNRGPRLPIDPLERALTQLGSAAETMPDDCHDRCVPEGHLAIYFPYKWRPDGRAWYQCAAGHVWICWWGYDGLSGDAPEYRATPVEVHS
jgi:hypothetical protein